MTEDSPEVPCGLCFRHHRRPLNRTTRNVDEVKVRLTISNITRKIDPCLVKPVHAILSRECYNNLKDL